jgi:hypothetical protein
MTDKPNQPDRLDANPALAGGVFRSGQDFNDMLGNSPAGRIADIIESGDDGAPSEARQAAQEAPEAGPRGLGLRCRGTQPWLRGDDLGR